MSASTCGAQRQKPVGGKDLAQCLSRWLKLRRGYEPERFTRKGRNIRPLLRQAEVELAAAAEDAGYLRKGPIISPSWRWGQITGPSAPDPGPGDPPSVRTH